MGLATVADWWVGKVQAVEFDTDAAATPTNTMERPKMRMASFIIR
jgi:hypothetical protein